MRNKDRIKPFLNQLEILWLKEPDLRFGQVICLLQNKMNKDDIFYPEDGEWEKAISNLNKEKFIGKKAVVTKVNDGLGNSKNDEKYISKAYNQIIKLVAIVPKTNGFYITDFFIPEYINENNDYIHYGFLKVSRQNITMLSE